MSYQDGLAAFNLEMPDKVPRTEYSAEMHWDLIQRVTGIEVSSQSPWDIHERASLEFIPCKSAEDVLSHALLR